ncbi:helix-turn-helix domain-containing protein [Amaricoccus sp. W119]|uniref:helix-turn-helix domain-containing protein n=1 Tax=Amaricoccus sp. W119 TaxID=3391833 RepID=UPI0039A75097
MPLIDQRLGARSERRGAGLSPASPRSGGSRDMIHKVECGNSSPTASLLAKLSGYFRLSMSTLLARLTWLFDIPPAPMALTKSSTARVEMP